MDSPLLVKSKQFALDIIKVCNKVKSEKRESVLTNQLIRSGTSIGANIREAFYAHGKNDFIAKLQIALKECSESEYWIELLVESGYYDDKNILENCIELKKILISSLIIGATTLALGVGALQDNDYYLNNCKIIIENREYLTKKLQELGFLVLPSKANFVFAKTDKISGEELYLKLKSKGVLVRHFTTDSIKEYNRITIGTIEQLDILLNCIKQILGETL